MKNERLSKFIDFICNKCKNSKADAAKFRRADTDKNNLAVMSTMVAFGIDITKDSMIIELTGTQSKVSAFIEMLSEYEILEIARTGIAGLRRGSDGVVYL